MNELTVQTKQELAPVQGEFVVSPQAALQQLKAIQAVAKEVMIQGEHYGVIPGTNKPTLLKPGAELLNNMYGFFLDDVEIVDKREEWDVKVTAEQFPLFRYLIRTKLKNRDGVVIATGIGECNSYEDKYRFRSQARRCPKCAKETIIKGKAEFGGGFLCYAKKGGCGAKFSDTDKSITEQVEGKMHNERIYDQVNTIMKMAKKRSYVDATLSATRTSGTFTQDMEDFASLSDIPEASYTVEQSSKSVQTDSGVTIGKEFDPSTECLIKGKYSGTMWSDLPTDYLDWASKQSGDLAIKARATLQWLSQRGDNQQGSSAHAGDVVDEMFPEKSQEENQVPIQEVLELELDEVARTFDVAKIIAWGNKRKPDVEKLPARLQTIFSKSLKSAVDQARKAESQPKEKGGKA